MGKTYKRDPDRYELDDEFEDMDLDLDADFDDDFLEPIARPDATARGGHRRIAPRAPSLSRSLPSDWEDFDYGGSGGDFADSVWR